MKKVIGIALAVALLVSLVPAVALATPPEEGYKGNGLPKDAGQSFNFNVIAVPKAKGWDMDGGGEGKRIFVLRTGNTKFYVAGQPNTFAIMDHDGTDGRVGENTMVGGHLSEPGIILPYDTGTNKWDCTVYVRLLGPNKPGDESSLHWKTSYYDGTAWAAIDEFDLDRSSKFAVPGQLFADGYQDVLWEWDAKHKLRICQFRIYVGQLEGDYPPPS
jgi:hypothetical protein